MKKQVLQFARRKLGLKNLVDYVEARDAMLGLSNLSINTVIDVGANKGRHTKAYRRKFPAARVIAIEPVPGLHEKLASWASTQKGSVEALNIAVSSAPGETTFYVNRKASIWSTLEPPPSDDRADYDPIPVRVDTLDNLSNTLGLEDDILIKIDTEGFDLEVIRGGRAMLPGVAAIIIETCFFPTRYGDNAPCFEDILAALSKLGFCYRGTIRMCMHAGVCNGADALFVNRSAAARLAA